MICSAYMGHDQVVFPAHRLIGELSQTSERFNTGIILGWIANERGELIYDGGGHKKLIKNLKENGKQFLNIEVIINFGGPDSKASFIKDTLLSSTIFSGFSSKITSSTCHCRRCSFRSP